MSQQALCPLRRKVLVDQEKRRVMTLKKFEGTGGVVGFPYFVPHVTQVVGQQTGRGQQ